MTVERIPGPDLARSLSVQASQYAWFLGAGASAAANVPTAYHMILDFKARLFCAAIGLPRREIDPSDPLWLDRIEDHFDGKHGFPPRGHPDEYAMAFEAVYPSEAERRSYIEKAVRKGSASFGHRVLAAMIVDKQTPCLFTTNFDPLIERAAIVADELLPTDRQAHLTVAALDSVDRADRCLRESAWPLLVKLHGDYKSLQLKNTALELQAQDAALRRVLVRACNRFGLIVVGYSGRDASVMDALREALEGPAPFPGGIRWVARGSATLLPPVIDFLDRAKDAGIDAKLVESETFDELAADVDRQLTLAEELVVHVRESRPLATLQPVVLPAADGSPFPVLRCSALPVLDLPSVARRVTLSRPMTTPEARSAVKAAGVRAIVAARGRDVVAFGADDDLLAAFSSHGGRVEGEIALSPLSDSVDLGLLYDALVRSLTRGRPLRPILRRSGHSIVVAGSNPRDRERLAPLQRAYSDSLFGTVPGATLPFAEGVRIRLEHHLDHWWCVFDPFTWVDFPRRERANEGELEDTPLPHRGHADPAGDWRTERWARRYNPKWSVIVDTWASLLVSGPEDTTHAVGLHDRSGIDALFTISGTTAWSRPARAAGEAS